VFICRTDLTLPTCRWRTADGIGMGTTLKEPERLNGKLFRKGNDIRNLSDEEKAEVQGRDEIVAASHPVLRKIKPHVVEFIQIFPFDGTK